MKPWCELFPPLLGQVARAIRSRCPGLAVLVDNGYVIAAGIYGVFDQEDNLAGSYKIMITFPQNFPDAYPSLWVMEERLWCNLERHVIGHGLACFCLDHEYSQYMREPGDIESFLDALVRPWMLGQAYYDKFGKWPFPAWAHGDEAYYQLFGEYLGISDKKAIRNFIDLVTCERRVRGHVRCPCGSGKRIRNCHPDIVDKARQAVKKPFRKEYRKRLEIDSEAWQH